MKRRHLFALLSIILSLSLSLMAAEAVLDYLQERIRSSDALDHGLMVYDPTLGWRLSPDWQGRHHHHDFDVGYRTNGEGYRYSPDQTQVERSVIVLGDSFTFGFGVEDEQTFCNLLNRRFQNKATGFHNFGIPGYSTDQEYLLLKRELQRTQPDHVVLVVYLANDLLDILRTYPLQAEYAKPLYSLDDDGRLELGNVPVPKQTRPAGDTADSLRAMILPQALQSASGPLAWLSSLQLVRRLGLLPADQKLSEVHLERVLKPSIELFGVMLREMREDLDRRQAGFSVVLLPGRSWLHDPGSYSAQFQQYLLNKLTQQLQDHGIAGLAFGTALRQAHQRGDTLYYRHDGHLTPQGNAWLAEQLDAFLSPRLDSQ